MQVSKLSESVKYWGQRTNYRSLRIIGVRVPYCQGPKIVRVSDINDMQFGEFSESENYWSL